MRKYFIAAVGTVSDKFATSIHYWLRYFWTLNSLISEEVDAWAAIYCRHTSNVKRIFGLLASSWSNNSPQRIRRRKKKLIIISSRSARQVFGSSLKNIRLFNFQIKIRGSYCFERTNKMSRLYISFREDVDLRDFSINFDTALPSSFSLFHYHLFPPSVFMFHLQGTIIRFDVNWSV